MALPDIQDITDPLSLQPHWARRRELRSGEFKMPRLVYKYMRFDPSSPDSVRNLSAIILDSSFWLSHPEDFNDPFDFQANIAVDQDQNSIRKWALEMIKDRNPDLSLQKQQRGAFMMSMFALKDPSFATKFMDEMRRDAGVTCFAPSAREGLMWAHYAGSHTGLCLAFSPEQDLDVLGQIQEVTYTTAFPTFSWPSESHLFAERVALSKSSDWQYEKELRLTAMIEDGQQKLPFNPSALRGLLLGARFPDQHLADLRQLLAERAKLNFPALRLYKAGLGRRDYKIRFHALPG